MDYDKILERATGGLKGITNDLVSPSSIRPLIFDDNGLAWLAEHGEGAGFHRDKGRYCRLPFVSKLSASFEEAFVRYEFPQAIRLVEHDWEVRDRKAFEKSLEHMQKGTKVMWKVPLWYEPASVYGCADFLIHSTVFYKRYSHLKPVKKEPDHFIVVDLKFSTNLTSSSAVKRQHLDHATTQVRLYSYIVGHCQGFMAPRGYVISRDSIDQPIEISVDLELDKPLDDDLTDLRDAFLDIRNRGAEMRPWRDKEVALNPLNKDSEPFEQAKAKILTEYVPRSLLSLPGVGAETARKMHLAGMKDVDDLLKRNIDRIRFEDAGINPAMADRLRAVLKANKTGQATEVTSTLAPKRKDLELYVDMESLSSLSVDFADWPLLTGTPMIFMIGIRYKEDGEWKFKRFTAAENTHEEESRMLRKYLAFLRKLGVYDPTKTVSLYCWSSAEEALTRQAAQRHNLWQLLHLPWVDVYKIWSDNAIAVPGQWSFSLKDVAGALAEYAPRYGVDYGEDGLSSGVNAQIAAWTGYEKDEPLKTDEMKLVAEYLSKDCESLQRIVAWMRYSANSSKPKEAHCGWWVRTAESVSASGTDSQLSAGGWYLWALRDVTA